MDLLTWQIGPKSMIRWLNREKLVFHAKFGDLSGNGNWKRMQNFSTISPKLCQLGQKNRGTWGANTMYHYSNIYIKKYVSRSYCHNMPQPP